MYIEPYLHFEGCCEEAVEFYKQAIGAQVTRFLRFKDSPNPEMCSPGTENKVMHAALLVGTTTVMASDGRCSDKPHFEGVSLSLTTANDGEAERLFTVLADGGQVKMPLTKTFFSSQFGMVADRFGVSWMILVQH